MKSKVPDQRPEHKAWMAQLLLDTIPGEKLPVLEWASKYMNMYGVRGKRYDPDISPWTKGPINDLDDPLVKISTFIKPVQAGGSVVGEIAICRWITEMTGGDIQYNWEDDGKASDRYAKRLERIFKGCAPVFDLWPVGADRNKDHKCMVIFPTANLTVQGVFVENNLDSDSISAQVNEEVHSWKEGLLAKARQRTTAVWNPKVFDISNAGKKDSQLHTAYDTGTCQRWEIKCPGCKQYHVMRTRWDDKNHKLGGLRYKAEDARLSDGRYNYEMIIPTIRYQMPCGFIVHDDVSERRALSLDGRYSAPRKGADPSHRSRTLEAVSVDYVSWLTLIQEKHNAIRALKNGDLEPWLKYVRERECIFSTPEDRPFYQKLKLSDQKKNRDGLAERVGRFGELDYQQGRLAIGELPHWWGSIYDVKIEPDGKLHTLLVFEGKMLTDEDAWSKMASHDVMPHCVCVDSGHDATHVYQFCMRYGCNSIKGGGSEFYSHDDGSKKIYSPQKPLHLMINAPPKYDYVMNDSGELTPDDREPLFWFYSKVMIRDRHSWISSGGNGMVDYEVPGDVSDDYKSHMEAEEVQDNVWVQVKDRNDLFVCACYFAMWLEIVGLIGAGAKGLEVNKLDADVKDDSLQPA